MSIVVAQLHSPTSTAAGLFTRGEEIEDGQQVVSQSHMGMILGSAQGYRHRIRERAR